MVLFLIIKELESQIKMILKNVFATNHVGAKNSDLNLRYTGCAALDLLMWARKIRWFFKIKLIFGMLRLEQ